MPSTCCSAPTFAMCGYCGAGSTSNRISASTVYARSGSVGVGLVAGGRRLRCAGAARQRKILALIEVSDAALVEAGFIDLQVSAVQRVRGQLLDREANRFGRGAESPIRETGPLFLPDRGGKQFGSGVEAEGSHGQGPLIFLVGTRIQIANGSHGRNERQGAPVHVISG